MYYPGVDFWDGQTRDQTLLKMEAVYEREKRDLIRASAIMNGLDDPSEALPRWTRGSTTSDGIRTTNSIRPFDFSLSAQRGIVEAVERGLIPTNSDVWVYQVVKMWESLLAATGDSTEWIKRENESVKKVKQQRRAG